MRSLHSAFSEVGSRGFITHLQSLTFARMKLGGLANMFQASCQGMKLFSAPTFDPKGITATETTTPVPKELRCESSVFACQTFSMSLTILTRRKTYSSALSHVSEPALLDCKLC